MSWLDIFPAALTGATALAGSLGRGDSLTGETAKPSRSGVQPSTEEGRRLLASLQNEILGAKPTNLSVNGANIPIMDPFLRQKARSAKDLMKGEVDGTPTDGGALGNLAWPLGAAAGLLGNVDSPMVDNNPDWGTIMSWVPKADDSIWDSWGGM